MYTNLYSSRVNGSNRQLLSLFFLAPPTYCIFLIHLLKIMTARTQVKRRGISRQVINYTVEQRQSKVTDRLQTALLIH